MTTAERIDVIDTLNLIKKHKDFAEMLGLVDRTKVVIGERRKTMVTKESRGKNKKKNRISKMCMNKKNNVKLTNCKGAGCRACDSPFYPDCIDSCPLFDD